MNEFQITLMGVLIMGIVILLSTLYSMHKEKKDSNKSH